MTDGDFLGAAQRLRKQGRADEALAVLREGLRHPDIAAEDVEKAGRLLRRLRSASPDGGLDIFLVGQCTTSWVKTMLGAVAWGHGVAANVEEGEFDNVIQDLSAAAAEGRRCDVVVLVPWTQRLLGPGSRSDAERVADELAFWKQAWTAARDGLGAHVLQVGYDWISPGAAGHHLGAQAGGAVHLVREANAALRAERPEGSYFLDLEQVSGLMGRTQFYDARRWFWTKQPFSEAGACEFARHLWSGVRALTTGPKKVLVLDLDNTLWGGVVGEEGPLGIALGESPDGEAFVAFQRHVKELGRRGCLLAVASKNNPDDAREAFEKNPDMVLALDDFAAFEASWERKSLAIQRMAKLLNLGLDSFVFFDDNPAEREEIRQTLPEVEVVEVPEDPAEYVRALDRSLFFETATITSEDAARRGQYQAEAQRRQMEQESGSADDYLGSLEMCAEIGPVVATSMPRVVQLLKKTNQFNLTTRRHTEPEVQAMLDTPRSVALTMKLTDRFGDYGLIAVMLGLPEGDGSTLRLDTWLMSCRAIGRTVEHCLFGELLDRARELGYARIVGEFIPTAKNKPVAELYPSLGFSRCASGAAGGADGATTPAEAGATAASPGVDPAPVASADDVQRFALELDGAEAPATFVQILGA